MSGLPSFDPVFNPVYRRYRFIALAVYGAVFAAGVVDFAYDGARVGALVRAPEGLRVAVFLLALALLGALEFFSFGHSSFERVRKSQLLPFTLRLFLFATCFLVTDLKYTRVLFLILILYSYLGVGRWLSYALATVGFIVLLGLSIGNPVLMGILPVPPQVQGPTQEASQQPVQQPPPRPDNPPLNIGELINASMGSVIALFFTLLLARAMAQALQDQQELRALNLSLNASHTQLKEYTGRVAELAATEERNRLARDIHDSLGHHLAAINIQLAKAHAYRERDPQRAAEAVGHAQRSVQDALKDVRESVGSLREGKAFSLDESLDALVKRMRHSGLDIKITKTGNGEVYGKLALMTLYRVVQEALTNVHKHAAAGCVTIDLEFSERQARLSVTDDGAGFDTAAWEDQPTFGLRGLQERLSLVGGTLHLHSEPKQTTLNVALPRSANG